MFVNISHLRGKTPDECIHLGNVEFGHMTEQDHLDNEYERYQDELSLIEMFCLQEKSQVFADKYKDCLNNMMSIHLKQLKTS